MTSDFASLLAILIGIAIIVAFVLSTVFFSKTGLMMKVDAPCHDPENCDEKSEPWWLTG